MTAGDDRSAISESSFCMFGKSHCRTHGERKHKWLTIVARDWHILMACGCKMKVILYLSTAGEIWSFCNLLLVNSHFFEFSAMLKGKDIRLMLLEKATMLDWYFSLLLSLFSSKTCPGHTKNNYRRWLNQSAILHEHISQSAKFQTHSPNASLSLSGRLAEVFSRLLVVFNVLPRKEKTNRQIWNNWNLLHNRPDLLEFLIQILLLLQTKESTSLTLT